MVKNEKNIQITVKVDEDLREKAKEKAKQQGLTLALVIRKMLDDYVNDRQGKLMF